MEAFCVSTSSWLRAKGYKKFFHSGVPNPAYYQDVLVHLKQNQKKEGKEGKKKGGKRKEGRERKQYEKVLVDSWIHPGRFRGFVLDLGKLYLSSHAYPTTFLSQVILMKTQVGSHDFIYSILSKAAA